jgi:hypothetical protein
MSILHKRLKIRSRALERNKGEGRELPIEASRCSSKKRRAAPLEVERASDRAEALEASKPAAAAA